MEFSLTAVNFDLVKPAEYNKDYSFLTGPQIVLQWLSMRMLFLKLQSKFSDQNTTIKFLIDNHYKTI